MNFRQFVTDNESVISEILDVFASHQIGPADGKAICLYVAGLSAGYRAAAMDGSWIEPMARAWQAATTDPH